MPIQIQENKKITRKYNIVTLRELIICEYLNDLSVIRIDNSKSGAREYLFSTVLESDGIYYMVRNFNRRFGIALAPINISKYPMEPIGEEDDQSTVYGYNSVLSGTNMNTIQSIKKSLSNSLYDKEFTLRPDITIKIDIIGS
jgi:hypothetical protein